MIAYIVSTLSLGIPRHSGLVPTNLDEVPIILLNNHLSNTRGFFSSTFKGQV
jgi:hypothetical protein